VKARKLGKRNKIGKLVLNLPKWKIKEIKGEKKD